MLPLEAGWRLPFRDRGTKPVAGARLQRRAAHRHQQRLSRSGRRRDGGGTDVRRGRSRRQRAGRRRQRDVCQARPSWRERARHAHRIERAQHRTARHQPGRRRTLPHRRDRRRCPAGAARTSERAGHLPHDPAVSLSRDGAGRARHGRGDRDGGSADGASWPGSDAAARQSADADGAYPRGGGSAAAADVRARRLRRADRRPGGDRRLRAARLRRQRAAARSWRSGWRSARNRPPWREA